MGPLTKHVFVCASQKLLVSLILGLSLAVERADRSSYNTLAKEHLNVGCTSELRITRASNGHMLPKPQSTFGQATSQIASFQGQIHSLSRR